MYREIQEKEEKISHRGIDIPEKALSDIRSLARQYDVGAILLFGSRGRGDALPKSDIDLAVYGCRDFYGFQYDVNENVHTLLMFDLINMDKPVSKKLADEIGRDGVLIYGKI